jgi:polysaccharide export outer membrane protein
MRRKICVVCARSLFVASVFYLQSCGPSNKLSKDYTYFQKDPNSLGTVNLKDAVIQPNDLLSIQVFSKSLNQDQAVLFNIPNTGTSVTSGYLVGTDGKIEMPVIGSIAASGLTRLELSNFLAVKLSPYVKDPSVLVRFLQFKVNVLGEVRTPGSYNFLTERVTIIDALSAAGDMTENGKRTEVLIIREERNGTRAFYTVDMRSAKLFQSPAFQLQQNDIVYVAATKSKLTRLDENPKAQRNFQNGLAIASFAAFLTNLIITLK